MQAANRPRGAQALEQRHVLAHRFDVDPLGNVGHYFFPSVTM